MPKRFHQSPDKKVVKIAVGYARRRSCVAQKLKKLEAELRANAQTRDEQMNRAIRSNLRLGAFL